MGHLTKAIDTLLTENENLLEKNQRLTNALMQLLAKAQANNDIETIGIIDGVFKRND